MLSSLFCWAVSESLIELTHSEIRQMGTSSWVERAPLATSSNFFKLHGWSRSLLTDVSIVEMAAAIAISGRSDDRGHVDRLAKVGLEALGRKARALLASQLAFAVTACTAVASATESLQMASWRIAHLARDELIVLLDKAGPDVCLASADPHLLVANYASSLVKMCKGSGPSQAVRRALYTDSLIEAVITALRSPRIATASAGEVGTSGALSPRTLTMLLMLLVQLAKYPAEHYRLLDAGVDEVVAPLVDCRLMASGRIVGNVSAGALALLRGQKECESGLNLAQIGSIVEEYKAHYSAAGFRLSGFIDLNNIITSLIRSDRHTLMLLEVGIIETLPLSWAFRSNATLQGNVQPYHESICNTNAELCFALALLPDGKRALLANGFARTMLQEIAADRSDGMKCARRSANGALFELDLAAQTSGPEVNAGFPRTAGTVAAAGATLGHTMLSYSWEQQTTVVRLAGALKAHGVSVWIDTEQLSGSGSTIDGMAQAVERASVVLLCMSKDYKESHNCKLEANYAVLKRAPYICLKLEEGYEPDGWLGIILGCVLTNRAVAHPCPHSHPSPHLPSHSHAYRACHWP